MGSRAVPLTLVLEPSSGTQTRLQTQTCCARRSECTGISAWKICSFPLWCEIHLSGDLLALGRVMETQKPAGLLALPCHLRPGPLSSPPGTLPRPPPSDPRCRLSWPRDAPRRQYPPPPPDGALGPALLQQRNQRERQRVRCVNLGYARLRDHLPRELAGRRLSKVDTLRAAIRYIKHLQELLGRHAPGQGDPAGAPRRPECNSDGESTASWAPSPCSEDGGG